MGLSQSQHDKKYTNEEITQNINNIFNMKGGNLESPFTYNNTVNLSFDNDQLGGNNVSTRFIPRRNRYDQYNIHNLLQKYRSNYQSGGDVHDINSNSALSELEQMRIDLNRQLGGEFNSPPTTQTENTADLYKLFNHNNVKVGGSKCDISDTSNEHLNVLQNMDTSVTSLSNLTEQKGGFDDDFDVEFNQDPVETEIEDPDIPHDDEYSTEQQEEEFDIAGMATTSSEINIVPFYSSEESDHNFKTPISKNRFN